MIVVQEEEEEGASCEKTPFTPFTPFTRKMPHVGLVSAGKPCPFGVPSATSSMMPAHPPVRGIFRVNGVNGVNGPQLVDNQQQARSHGVHTPCEPCERITTRWFFPVLLSAFCFLLSAFPRPCPRPSLLRAFEGPPASNPRTPRPRGRTRAHVTPRGLPAGNPNPPPGAMLSPPARFRAGLR